MLKSCTQIEMESDAFIGEDSIVFEKTLSFAKFSYDKEIAVI
jgi:hypothetical protein